MESSFFPSVIFQFRCIRFCITSTISFFFYCFFLHYFCHHHERSAFLFFKKKRRTTFFFCHSQVSFCLLLHYVSYHFLINLSLHYFCHHKQRAFLLYHECRTLFSPSVILQFHCIHFCITSTIIFFFLLLFPVLLLPS